MQVAVGFIKECGSMLQDLSPQGLHSMSLLFIHKFFEHFQSKHSTLLLLLCDCWFATDATCCKKDNFLEPFVVSRV